MISPPPSFKIYCPPPDPGHTWLRPLCEAWWQASSVRHPAALLVVVGQAQPPGLDLPIRGEYCAPPITAHLVPAAAGVLALPPELLQRIVLCPGIAWESKYLQKNDLRKAFRNETFLLRSLTIVLHKMCSYPALTQSPPGGHLESRNTAALLCRLTGGL